MCVTVGILVRELESDVSKAIMMIFCCCKDEKTLPAMGGKLGVVHTSREGKTTTTNPIIRNNRIGCFGVIVLTNTLPLDPCKQLLPYVFTPWKIVILDFGDNRRIESN